MVIVTRRNLVNAFSVQKRSAPDFFLLEIPSVCGTHTVQSSKEPANQSRKFYRKTVVDRSAVSPAAALETTPILLPTVAALCCGGDGSAEGLG